MVDASEEERPTDTARGFPMVSKGMHSKHDRIVIILRYHNLYIQDQPKAVLVLGKEQNLFLL